MRTIEHKEKRRKMIALVLSISIHLAAALALFVVTQPDWQEKVSGIFGKTQTEAVSSVDSDHP